VPTRPAEPGLIAIGPGDSSKKRHPVVVSAQIYKQTERLADSHATARTG
jgi:hypothetical protein